MESIPIPQPIRWPVFGLPFAGILRGEGIGRHRFVHLLGEVLQGTRGFQALARTRMAFGGSPNENICQKTYIIVHLVYIYI